MEYGEELVAAVPWEVATDDGGAPWPRIVELLREAPVEFDSEAEERACAAEDVAARAQLEELVGEVNRLLEQRGTDQVVVLVDDDRRPAGNIDRWWPVEVRSALRRTLA